MSRDDAVVLDVLTAARRAAEFAAGLTLEQLGADLKTQSKSKAIASRISRSTSSRVPPVVGFGGKNCSEAR